MMIFDISKPMPFKTGLYSLNKNVDYNFQLNRLINMDGADKKLVEKIAGRIHDDTSWKAVLLKCAEKLDSVGNIRNAAAFSYVDSPKGVIVMNGGFDSSYEEFFPPMEYLRENGYTVYLFEDPGQGACIRLYGAPLTLQWEKPVKAILDYFALTDVCLMGASLGGYYSPRAAAYEKRITCFVSWPAFPSLRGNMNAAANGSWNVVSFVARHFDWLLDRRYHKNVRVGKSTRFTKFLKTYFHRLGCSSVSELLKKLESIDMASFGSRITQDVLLLGAENDDIVLPGIAEEQCAAERKNLKRILLDWIDHVW